jgi:hypothetical protein
MKYVVALKNIIFSLLLHFGNPVNQKGPKDVKAVNKYSINFYYLNQKNKSRHRAWDRGRPPLHIQKVKVSAGTGEK